MLQPNPMRKSLTPSAIVDDAARPRDAGGLTPWARLSSFYLIYFAGLGAFVPYWSVYLESLHFSPRQIGELMAVVMATKVFAPYFWGWLADRRGNRIAIVRWLTALAALAFSLILLRHDYWWLLAVLALFSFFWHATLPQFEAITLEYLGMRRARYSHIRLWGSIGFILAVTGMGFYLERGDVRILPAVVSMLMVAVWLTTLLVRRDAARPAIGRQGSIAPVIRQPVVIAFLLGCLMMQASHGPYYTFFSVYLAENGYSSGATGQLWALGVVAEIGVFLLAHRWLPAIGAPRLFVLAALITAARWLLIGALADHLAILIFAQTLHAASYGLFHASAMELLQHFFPASLQGRGQALYAGVGFGIGNASGSLFAGYVWSGLGASWAYYLASGLCLIAALLGLFVIRVCGGRCRSLAS